MPGPVSKDRSQRRRRNEPARGEWIDLVPLEKPVLPVAKRDWPATGRAMWNAWRKDPTSGLWGASEVALAADTARLWEELPPASALRRLDGLGLTLKGKRDLRLRLPAETEKVLEASARVAEVRRLRAVG